jgi:hypothetical protein
MEDHDMFGGRIGVPELLILVALFLIVSGPLMIIAWWRIFAKAGHPGALSLVMLIPIINFFLLFWFAFTSWPIEQQTATLAPPRALPPL